MKLFLITVFVVGMFSLEAKAQYFTDYEAVAASATTQTLGPVGGAGDVVSRLILNVTALYTSNVSLIDGAATTLSVASTLTPVGVHVIDVNARSVNGPWKVTTGAGVSVIGVGKFK